MELQVRNYSEICLMELQVRGASKTYASGLQALKKMTFTILVKTQRGAGKALASKRFGWLCEP